jgi:hypothetical protein
VRLCLVAIGREHRHSTRLRSCVAQSAGFLIMGKIMMRTAIMGSAVVILASSSARAKIRLAVKKNNKELEKSVKIYLQFGMIFLTV